MGFQIRQTRPATLQAAMETAQNYENSVQSLRKARRRGKTIHKPRKGSRYSGSEDPTSRSSSSSNTSDSTNSDASSPSPKRASSSRKGRKDPHPTKAKVKKEAPEDSESKKMMKDIHEALEAIKVNLAENRKPRRTLPTTRSNIWCTKCGEPGHYPSECQRRISKQVQFVDAEGTVYFTVPESEEDELEDTSIYQVAPVPGRGKAPQQLYRVGNPSVRPQNPGLTSGMTSQPRYSGFPERQSKLCYICGSPMHFANVCPSRGPGEGAPLPLPCQNCQRYGHVVSQCQSPVQARTTYKQVEVPPRDQTALNYGHQGGIENPGN